MSTHIWAVESLYRGEWRFVTAFHTRGSARFYQSAHFGPGASRIRKYIPA